MGLKIYTSNYIPFQSISALNILHLQKRAKNRATNIPEHQCLEDENSSWKWYLFFHLFWGDTFTFRGGSNLYLVPETTKIISWMLVKQLFFISQDLESIETTIKRMEVSGSRYVTSI